MPIVGAVVTAKCEHDRSAVKLPKTLIRFAMDSLLEGAASHGQSPETPGSQERGGALKIGWTNPGPVGGVFRATSITA